MTTFEAVTLLISQLWLIGSIFAPLKMPGGTSIWSYPKALMTVVAIGWIVLFTIARY